MVIKSQRKKFNKIFSTVEFLNNQKKSICASLKRLGIFDKLITRISRSSYQQDRGLLVQLFCEFLKCLEVKWHIVENPKNTKSHSQHICTNVNCNRRSKTWQLISTIPVDSKCCTMLKCPVLAARWRHVEPSTSWKEKKTGCDQSSNRVNVPQKAFDYRMLY